MDVVFTQMHTATLAVIIFELVLFGAQLALWLNRPDERQRFWYLVLLVLLLACNVTRGLFPNDGLDTPVHVQHRINYGVGFLTASYFPFYFYRAFGLAALRFHAFFVAPLFFLVPYTIFFLLLYPGGMELETAVRQVVIVPFLYALILLWSILRAIRKAYSGYDEKDKSRYSEEMLVYLAVVLWALVAMVLYFRLGQLAETIFTNTGFLVTSVVLLSRSVRLSRRERQQYRQIRLIGNDPRSMFDLNCSKYGLTPREIEVAAEVRRGLTNPAIADTLHISLATVKSHIEHIMKKTDVHSRYMLVQKLAYGEDGQL